MKYDDSEYCFLNFETDLDNEAANTHIGMYLAWAIHAGLARDDDKDPRWMEAVARVRARAMTGAQLLSDMCDGKLTAMEFNEAGNEFTAAYYAGGFTQDYEGVFKAQMPDTGHDTDDFCSVPDTWASFDRLKPLLDQRYARWKAGRQARELSLVGDSPAAPPPPPPPPAPAGPAPDMAALRRRADGGDRDAWYELAVEYLTGAHVPRDFRLAADAFEKAAQAGIPEAAFNLGVCYQNGDGRPKDAKQRLRWFALAAEGGHGQAAYFLAQAYRQGDQVPQDFIASNALMLLAQRRGVEEARNAGVMAGSLSESMALSAQLAEPGRLVALLSSRRRKVLAGQADTGVERFNTATMHTLADNPAGGAAESAERADRRIGLAALPLLVSFAGLVLLVLFGDAQGPRFKPLAGLLSLIGASGVFAVAPSLGLRGAMRGIVTLLAAIPIMGSLVALFVLLSSGRRREA